MSIGQPGLNLPAGAVSLIISGTPGVGNVLTVPSGYSSYQWLRNGVAIASATTASYTQVTADLGASITCFAASPPITVPPTAPAAPVVTAYGGNAQNSVYWVDGATNGSAIVSHNIYRNGTLLANTTGAGPYVDSTAVNGTAYTYQITALNGATSPESALSTSHTVTPSASFPAFAPDADAQLIINAFIATGTTPTYRQQWVVNNTVIDLKLRGIWAAAKAFTPAILYFPSNVAAWSLINWLYPGTNNLTPSSSPPTFKAPSAPAVGAAVTNPGWLASTSSQYLDSGVPYGSFNQNNITIMLYRGTAAGSANIDCGVLDGTGGLLLSAYNTSSLAAARLFSPSLGTVGTTANWDGSNIVFATRTSSTASAMDHNAEVVGTSTVASAAAATPSLTYRFCTANGSSSPSAGSFTGGYAGPPLSATQRMYLYANMRRLFETVSWGDVEIHDFGVGAPSLSVDVLVHGWTFGAEMAAFEVSRQGHSVVCSGDWNDYTPADIGGMPTNGLGLTDYNQHSATGGLVLTAFSRAQAVDAISDGSYSFLPRSMSFVLRQMLDGTRGTGRFTGQNVPHYAGGGVASASYNAGTGYTVQMVDGRIINAKIVLDCSYNGDLLAALGVPLVTGREAATASALGGNAFNGYLGKSANADPGGLATGYNGTQVPYAVSPYVDGVSPSSGFIQGIAGNMLSETVGQADGLVQSMGYRLTVRVNIPAQQIQWSSFFTKVMGGTPQVPGQAAYASSASGGTGPFEMIGRFSAAVTANSATMAYTDNYFPRQIGTTGYYDVNTTTNMSLDLMGSGTAWANAGSNYASRLNIYQKIQNYTLQQFYYQAVDTSDTRLPAIYVTQVQNRALCDNHNLWPNQNGFLLLPNQVYSREFRRMLTGIGGAKWTGDTSFQYDGQTPVLGINTAATASYFLDHHPMDRYCDLAVSPAGIWAEGSMHGSGACGSNGLGPVPFEVLCPDKSVLPNIGTCWSIASDSAGYGCIRLEPTVGQLGQTLGMAACVALDNGVTLQDAGTTLYATATTGLRARLLATPETYPPVLLQTT